MNSTSGTLSLIGRILIAVMFLVSGFDKISGFEATVRSIASKGFPAPEVFTVASIIVEIGAGLMLVVGWRARWAALALIAFTMLVTFFYHNFWALPEAQKMLQQILFLKNGAIVGGLLFVMAFGPGRLSIDRR